MATLNIVQIQSALGLPITATFISDVLKVPVAGNEKRAVWWELGQYEAIVDALIAHIQNARSVNVAAIDSKRKESIKPTSKVAPAQIASAQIASAQTAPDLEAQVTHAGSDDLFGESASADDLFGESAPQNNDDLFG